MTPPRYDVRARVRVVIEAEAGLLWEEGVTLDAIHEKALATFIEQLTYAIKDMGDPESGRARIVGTPTVEAIITQTGK